MNQQDEHNPDLLGPFLLDAQEEMLDIILNRYGDGAAGCEPEEIECFRTACSSFTQALTRFSSDPEIKAVIDRRYRGCGRILGIISGNRSKTGIILERLDEKSRIILLTLIWNGHATLDELSVAARSTHYEVLQSIRGVINPLSQHMSGKPFAKFKESNTDPLTGEKILFSWWMNDSIMPEPERVEVTEGDKTIFLTAEMTGVDLPRTMRASATFHHGILEVTVEKGGIKDGR